MGGGEVGGQEEKGGGAGPRVRIRTAWIELRRIVVLWLHSLWVDGRLGGGDGRAACSS